MDTLSAIIGWAGFALLLTAWLPQTWATIKAGSTPLNAGFILLYVTSSLLLAIHAAMDGDLIFTLLNGLLTVGSGISLYYRFFPRAQPA